MAKDTTKEAGNITEDKLLGGKVILFQPKKGYRVAMDSCLLAAAVPAHAGQRILDLGVGTGAVSLCLRARIPKIAIVGIDKNTAYLELAQKSIAKNDWQDAIDLHFGDVCHPPKILQEGSFDFVVANPPYFEAEAYFKSPHAGKSEAHAAHGSCLGDWIGCAARFVKPDGAFVMIYPADKEQELLNALQSHFQHIRILRIYSDASDSPIRVITTARFAEQGRKTVEEAGSLVIREKNKEYTPQARAILWDGEGITP